MDNKKQNVAQTAKTALQAQDKLEKTPSIINMIERQSAGFKLALPKDFDAGRFTRIAITAVRSNEKLMKCDPFSLLGALMTCAQLGLEPNSPLKEAYLIPYKDQCQFQVSYRGLEKLAWNSGLIDFIDYDKICENDEFEFVKGLNPDFIHKPNIKGERGAPFAYYAVAGIRGGGRAIIVKSASEIMAHAKKFSKTWNGKNFGGKFNSQGIWDTDFDAMAIKTCLIELIDKKLPKRTTNEALIFAQAAQVDSAVISMDKKQVGIDEKISIDDLNVKHFDENEFETADIVDASATEAEEQKGGIMDWINEGQ